LAVREDFRSDRTLARRQRIERTTLTIYEAG
jgi:hypothetical protein